VAVTHTVNPRPGTGKTVTVVEAILQLLDRDPKVSILACAPSNSAADLIAERLKVLGPSQLFRLNAASREYKTLPKILQEFSLVNGDLVFAIPPLERMVGFRVVVATCVSGGVPHGLGVRRGHFSHIFLDEAAQCMEPEAMIPIKTMADNRTNIILAGDFCQLGPSIRSSVAGALGLGRSYLARLAARVDVYDLNIGTGATYVFHCQMREIQVLSNDPPELSSLSKISGPIQLFWNFPIISFTTARSNLMQIPFSHIVFFGAILCGMISPSFFMA
jgi:helicase MOV-10